MAAAAFTGTMVFKGLRNGATKHIRCTMSDVAAAGWVFPDGGTTLQMPSDQDYALVDVIIITGGTDTSNSDLYVNQLQSGLVIDHKSNLNTVQNRQFYTNPQPFAAGAQLKLVQRA